MAEGRRHRGAHPDDARLFGEAALPTLRRAAEEVVWLLGRGYPMAPAVAAVGGHHQLEQRQRVALGRALCSPERRAARRASAIGAELAAGKTVSIDGFNLIILLEVALSRGVVLEGWDGAPRDLAGLRGSYRLVEETERAIDLAGGALAALGVAGARFLLERMVSNSGRLRALLVERARDWPLRVEVEMVANADPILAREPLVVTGDAAILDRCPSWLNLGQLIIAESIGDAWRVDFLPRD